MRTVRNAVAPLGLLVLAAQAFVPPPPPLASDAKTASWRLQIASNEIENVGQDVVVPDDDESSTPTHAAEYGHMTTLPRHTLNEEVNVVLAKTEIAIRNMQENELFLASQKSSSAGVDPEAKEYRDCEEIPLEVEKESVYANSYIDLGKVDTVGFDYGVSRIDGPHPSWFVSQFFLF